MTMHDLLSENNVEENDDKMNVHDAGELLTGTALRISLEIGPVATVCLLVATATGFITDSFAKANIADYLRSIAKHIDETN